MLPTESLRSGTVTISHKFQPMAAVGGDFLDYFQLPDGNVGLYLGDVSGKGLPAALYAALAVGTLRGIHKTGTPPSEVLALLNRRLLLRGIPRRHVAIHYAVFDPRTFEMCIASAGMIGPFHVSEKGCKLLELPGMPPGLFPVEGYDSLNIQLHPGDSVFFCTDGLTDAVNTDGEQFGVDRLHLFYTKNQFASPTELLERAFATVDNFSADCDQQDDMAAILFHFAG